MEPSEQPADMLKEVTNVTHNRKARSGGGKQQPVQDICCTH